MRACILLCALSAACSRSPPPVIEAILFGFPEGSTPVGFTNALAQVFDPSGRAITNASVKINGSTLAWVPAAQQPDYEGSIAVVPGAPVALSVDVGGDTYTASTVQFASYPVLSAPAPGTTWDAAQANTISWSGGTPTDGARYLLAVLDPADVNGQPSVQTIDLGVSSSTVAPGSLTPGSKVILLGIEKEVTIPGADERSVLLLAGFAVGQVTVATLSAIEVTPAVASIPKGTMQQYAATGVMSDGSRRDLTGVATWTSPDWFTATISSGGLAAGAGVGMVPIQATFEGVSGSATLTVSPPVLVSVASVTPGEVSIPVGVTQPFAALGTFTDGSMQDITALAIWSASPSIATFGSVAAGSADTIAKGTTTITASVPGHGSAFTTLTVNDWTAHDSGTSHSLWGAAWSGTRFVVVGDAGMVLTSPDGATWTPQASGVTDTLRAVAWSGSQFVAVGGVEYTTLTADILTSPDGVTWTVRAPGVSAPLRGVAWSGTQFVAVGGIPSGFPNPGAVILTSPDGIDWTSHPAGSFSLNGIAWSGTQFIAVGGGILSSSDGVSWTAASVQLFDELAAVSWSGSQFTAVGYGAIAISTDGADWAVHDARTLPFLPGVVWTGATFVAVGTWGSILSSADGVAWTPDGGWPTALFEGPYLYGIARSPACLVAFGSDGSILTNP